MPYSRGKCAAITGAGSGIGRALAQALHAGGCRLFLADVDEAGLAATQQSLRGEPPVATRLVDVADQTAVQAWAGDIASSTGHLDILVNNAGVALAEPAESARYEDVQWLMGINFWGVVHGTTAFLPLLRRAPTGHLVNLSSVFGLVGIPTRSAYNASKFAVRGYTEALRQELAGSNVHVCCVHPGGIRTNIARRARGAAGGLTAEERGARFDKVARTTPEAAASSILRAIEKRKKRLLIGADARYISLISRLFPVSYPRLLPGLGGIGQAPATAAD